MRADAEVSGRVKEHEQVSGARLAQLLAVRRARPGPPQVLLVLATDEAAYVEAKLQAGRVAKSQRLERYPEFRRPPGSIARDCNVPNAIPILVEVIEVGQLGVPAGTVGIRPEHECAAAVAEAVDKQLHVVIARQIGVPAQLRCTNAARFAVVRAYPDVEGSRIAEGLDDGAFGCGLADVWLTLPEVSQRVGPRPVGFVQLAIQVDLAARRR